MHGKDSKWSKPQLQGMGCAFCAPRPPMAILSLLCNKSLKFCRTHMSESHTRGDGTPLATRTRPTARYIYMRSLPLFDGDVSGPSFLWTEDVLGKVKSPEFIRFVSCRLDLEPSSSEHNLVCELIGVRKRFWFEGAKGRINAYGSV